MTRHEQRCSNINNNLFEITQDMPEELKQSRVGIFKEKAMTDQALDGKNIIDVNGLDKKYNFREYHKDQTFFVIVSRQGFLNENHPALILDTVVEKLDLTKLYEKYSHEGNAAYHPKMMLKILFYAYYDGIMSARTIWDAVIHRSDFIFLAAGEVPDFRTINRFRLIHLDILPELFTQIVMLCRELDLIDFKHLSIDGEKIQASASYRNSKNLKGIKKEYDKITEGLAKLLTKEVNEHFTQETKEKRTGRLKKKLDQLESYQKILEEMGDEEKRINMVDPDAPVMVHKDSQKLPSYNHQSARDEKFGVVTAAQTTLNVDVAKDLLTVTDNSIENTGKEHDTVTADSGFCDFDILQKVEEERNEDFYLPDRRYESDKKGLNKKGKFNQSNFKKNENGKYVCPAGLVMKEKGIIKDDNGNEIIIYEGTGCENCNLKQECTTGKKRTINIDSRIPFRDRMREKLDSDQGREIYMKRQGLAEPVHGDDQKNKGWIQHHLRGFKKASGEFLLMRIATNLGIIVKHRPKEVLSWV